MGAFATPFVTVDVSDNYLTCCIKGWKGSISGPFEVNWTRLIPDYLNFSKTDRSSPPILSRGNNLTGML